MYDTAYRVSLYVPEVHVSIPVALKDVDTGIKRWPDDPELGRADPLNGLIHARRGVAAAAKAAAFLQKRLAVLGIDHTPATTLTIRLRTSRPARKGLVRGVIRVADIDVQLVIGNTEERAVNAVPAAPHTFDPIEIDVSTNLGGLPRALAVLENAGGSMVTALTRALSSQSP